jgi:hypothetical protein
MKNGAKNKSFGEEITGTEVTNSRAALDSSLGVTLGIGMIIFL